MKKLLLIAVLFSFTALFAEQANASKYSIDQDKVDVLFENADEAQFNIFTEAEAGHPKLVPQKVDGKDPMVAILLDFFVGGLGVHRFYLGTKTMTGVGYILTCGGIFGVMPLVDLIVLAVNYEDISPYVDNPSFFMW
ncbi:MAG: TM2 domain-containing protein [Bacteroidales bacterium]|nr:TM2 domain-containing protein [Bacteroidales bacterium]MCF8336845.1 TM2 domain-containing protein [Bacteroidales bacterium]